MTLDCRAFTCGCSDIDLSSDERSFIKKYQPWGLILFKRNVRNQEQLLRITADFRELTGRENAPVLIDQEGGRVQRMGPPDWRSYPAASRFDQISGKTLADKAGLVRAGAQLIAEDLIASGINVDCYPVLDVPVAGAHDVIGDRAYSRDPALVATYAEAACAGLMAGGVQPIVKHIPGHGRAGADSHLELPRVYAPLDTLEKSDFVPFRTLASLPSDQRPEMAMSAHVVYSAIDDDLPATLSSKVVSSVVRGSIGFDGLIMSDDLSMKALAGSFTEKTEKLFAAGLDIALHCSGDLREAADVALASPWLDGKSAERAVTALDTSRASTKPIDSVEAARQLDAMLANQS